MTRPESDGETPGWRIRRAKPSPTAPLLVLVVLAALIAGAAGYLVGSSGKDDSQKEVAAPTAQPRVATPLPITVPPQVATAVPTLPPSLPATATPNANPSATPMPGGPVTSPTPGTPVSVGTPRPASTTAPAPGQSRTYPVVGGDSLFGIADKLNVPAGEQQAWVSDLQRMNNVTAATLQPGMVLQLPPNTPPPR